jgi:DNA polymerase-3 subunit beta
MPALECIHFRADEELKLTATNLELRVSTRCPAMVERPGEALIPAKLLTELLRTLPKSSELALEASGTTVTLATPDGTYTIAGLSPEEFPGGDATPEPCAELSADAIQQITRHVLFAVATEPLRVALTGVLFEFRPDALHVVATDGYRLSRLRIPVQNHRDGSLLIPADTVELLDRLKEPVRIGWDDTSVAFTTGTTTIVGRLIAERFPAYEQVIPQQAPLRCRVERERIMDALERVSLFAPSSARIVRLRFTAGSLILHAEDEARGEARELVPCDYDGTDFLIGFNARYLGEALKAAHAEELLLEFSEPTKPLVIRWADTAEMPIADSPLVILVMPVRL